MNTARIESLLQLRKEDPTDPFYPYALSLEYASDNQYIEKAIDLLTELRESHPDYLPLYYQLGSLLKVVGQSAVALEIVEKGMQRALEQHQQHAFRELDFLKEDLE
jgi:hypothetical protein